MEIKGKVIAILPQTSGQGKNGEWKSQDFIIETEGKFPKKIAINLYGEKISLLPNIGEDVAASIEIESREFNGRWYTTIRAWKIEISGGAQEQNAQQQPTPEPPKESDLPF